MDAQKVRVQRGLPEECRDDAARLYDKAFGDKFARAVRSPERRRSLLAPVLRPQFAMAATFEGELVGLAGVQTPEGSFTGGLDFEALREHLGWLRGLWAGFVLSQYERTPEPGQLVMDGIAVDARWRGLGIGGRLLEAVMDYAREIGCQRVRLDVIDTNPRARKLYEARGFRAVKTESYPYLRWFFGFGGSTTMEREVQ